MNFLPKISAPATRALTTLNIKTLEDLTNFTEKEISNLHGMGPNALGKLHQSLLDNGLSFANK